LSINEFDLLAIDSTPMQSQCDLRPLIFGVSFCGFVPGSLHEHHDRRFDRFGQIGPSELSI
jgi:hypothetical protein